MAKLGLVGQVVRLHVEEWGRLGEAVAFLDGQRIYVFGSMPGEEVLAEVTREYRRYASARVVEIITASPERVVVPCPFFGPCTGCQWQHINYRYQLQIKNDFVTDALVRIGGFRQPPVTKTIASPEQFGYRNHARFTVRDNGTLGFVNRESRKFVRIDNCMIMHEGVNNILGKLQGYCGETTQLSVRYGINTGDFLVQPSLSDSRIGMPTGQKHYTESLRGRKFRVASPSFFQVNLQQLDCLLGLVKQRLKLSGKEVVVDAYSGVGTFALLLAPYSRKIIAIEESPAAVEDAKANTENIAGVEFLTGRTEDVLGQLREIPHGVILDPPRKGCHPSVLAALNLLNPQRVVYVSCDPETLARDLKILCQGSFHLEEVQPIDMFPQTYHIESVATLRQRNTIPGLILASSSPRRQELLTSLGISAKVVPPSVLEDFIGEEPEDFVVRLALAKSEKVANRYPGRIVIAADTTVVLENRVLGKPDSSAQAVDMLRSLRGKKHRVITGVVLIDGPSGSSFIDYSSSVVYMREYSDDEIWSYVASGNSDDKAGAYGIQDEKFHPALWVEGCLSNVVGLPLCTVERLMNQAGYDTRGLHIPVQCIEHQSRHEVPA